ncbi:ABC transporter permease [Hydrogenophaga sp. H7]|jgi:ABC-2 type transport system permease protein|uniref:ABC transporter permease n=1 Tax=Hydrogenophaga sp. H7 TaxID=1882399 RepID=UPI0009A2789C|nr:ABC transporter permease [Hydrogenophaga sp. H7]OPF64156.1 multidrug ABC transporter permease [Hydrogenophaga sp. H7]
MQTATLTTPDAAPALLPHLLRALRAVVGREIGRFLRQPSRLGSALVRPLLWFVVFSAGFHNVFGVAIAPPYETYVEYKEYMVPGLLGMVALFNGMQSSLSMVYDREMGVMRLLLTAPLARGWLLAFKLLAGTALSVLQMVVFLAIAWAFGVELPLLHLPAALLAMVCGAVMLASVGLVLSVYVKQLENFAGTMNFVIFPMFFISPALYPLWKLEESGAWWLLKLAQANPFTHAVEAIRFAMYGQFNTMAWAVVLGCTVVFFVAALWGYDPQRGSISKKPGG